MIKNNRLTFVDLISKEECLITQELTNKDTMNIVYCIDDKYSLCCGVSMYSLLHNNKDINIIIHLFVLSLSETNKNNFIDMVSSYNNVVLNLYYVNSEFKINEHNQKYFPLSASLRIITPEILKDKCDYMLYLDADTLIVNSIKEFLNYKNDKTISAILDVSAYAMLIRTKLSTGLYFNSGVLFINNQKWTHESITHKTIELLTANNFEYPDQDALNTILSNDCNYLPVRLNGHYYTKRGVPCIYDKGSVIIHYASEDKPWFKLFISPLYKSYLNETPWRNNELNIAKNARRIRIYSKNIKKQSKVKSIKYYLLYLLIKLKEKARKA